MSSNIFVTTLDSALAERLRSDLKAQDFEITVPLHTVFSGRKKGISCTLYKSGKLTVQGSGMREFVEFYLEPEILKNVSFTYPEIVSAETLDLTGRIGIDESGKGDFFGPLCIAGVFAEGKSITKLKAMGVRDSKTLTEAAIIKIGHQIRSEIDYHIVRINPSKYNELYSQFLNLNTLLAWGHATAIEQLVLKTNCKNVIIDQFAAERVVETALKRKKLQVELTQRHRGEEDVVVAAASILARCEFLEGLKKLGEEYGMVLPKGASAATIAAGKKIFLKYGEKGLVNTSKVHFKTYNVVTQGKIYE